MADYGALALKAYEPVAELIGLRRWTGRLTELSFNGPGDIWVRVAGQGYTKVAAKEAAFATADWAQRLCSYFAAANGFRWSNDMPLIACRTPDGHRFIMMLGNNVESGFGGSIRIRRAVKVGYENFEVPPEWQAVIDEAIAGGANIVLSGGTGSGKTTFLNFMLSKVPLEQRIITIEDTRELIVPHENRTHLIVSRTEASSRIGYPQAIDWALRANPDRLMLGEISIPNAFPLVQAWDTGHTGNMTTGHANSPMDMLRGICRRVALGGGAGGAAVVGDMLEMLIANVHLVLQIKHLEHEGGNRERRIVTDCIEPRDLLDSRESREAFAEREATFGQRFEVERARDLLLAANAGEPLSSTQRDVLRTLGLVLGGPRPAAAREAQLSPEEETMLEAGRRGLREPPFLEVQE